MNIQSEIDDLKERSKDIEKEISAINDLLYKDGIHTLSIQTLTKIFADFKSVVDRHTKVLETHQVEIQKIQTEDRRARNNILYMFISLIVITIGKFIFNISLKG